MRTDLLLDALEQALWARKGTEGVIHYSDTAQYLSIRYTERLSGAGVESSVGSTGESYDNALAETINGLKKMRSSTNTVRSELSTRWNMRHCIGLIGLIIAGYWGLSALSRRLNWKWRIIPNWKTQPWWLDSNKRVPGVPGAIQIGFTILVGIKVCG